MPPTSPRTALAPPEIPCCTRYTNFMGIPCHCVVGTKSERMFGNDTGSRPSDSKPPNKTMSIISNLMLATVWKVIYSLSSVRKWRLSAGWLWRERARCHNMVIGKLPLFAGWLMFCLCHGKNHFIARPARQNHIAIASVISNQNKCSFLSH